MAITPQLHGMMILFVAAVVLAVWAAGRSARKKEAADKAARRLGYGVVTLWVAYNVYYFLPSVFEWSLSLPLHVCDVLAPVTLLALARNNRKARAILYFGALPFAGQVILTPVGNQDPALLRFWFYWSFHAGLLAASFFDFSIRSFRPRPADLASAFAFDICYVLVILPIDVLFSWDYGYIGNAVPDVSTIINKVGPWPQRVFVLLGISFAL